MPQKPPFQSAQLSRRFVYVSLGLVALVLFWALTTRYRSAGPTPTTPTTPVTTNFQKIISPNAFFYSKVFLDRSQTFISIPFRFDSESDQPLWLLVETQPGIERLTRLIYHPDLIALDWPQLTQDGVTLYQKNDTYASFDDFIASPPASDTLLLDPGLRYTPPYDTLQATLFPESAPLDLSTIEYVLTTFAPPRQENDSFFFETTLDTTLAQPNDQNELVWLILAPLASETNPFYIGNIHVDYR